MNELQLRPFDSANASELTALQSSAFDDYEESDLLASALAEEAKRRVRRPLPDHFGLVAYRNERLIGWTQGYRQGRGEYYMLNSGVASDERRTGVYSSLVKATLAHAQSEGYVKVTSHHAAGNSSVLIAKIRLGFIVSGFQYSEVYGPLVQLTYILGQTRRELYRVRAASLRTPR